MMTYDEVLSRFDVKSRGNGTAQAICPAHDDRNASLSISRADNGGVVFKCHAECETENVLSAAGLDWPDVQPDDPTWKNGRTLRRRTAARIRPKPPKAAAPAFWTAERREALRAAQERLRAEPDHPLVKLLADRDGIDHETAARYGCGIIRRRDGEWLAFPYPTGCQLYRRPDGRRELKAWADGSEPRNRPSASFFGQTQTAEAPALIIAKSPREAMLLSAFADVDVIGLPGGEKPALSAEQTALLRSLKGLESARVVLDCDTDTARDVAERFARDVAAALHPAPVGLVDVWRATGGRCKDLTDAWKAEGFEAVAKLLAGADPVDPPPELRTAPPIPRIVYAALDAELWAACEPLREGYERDVFLMGLLPCLSSAMPHIVTRYARRWKALPLMAAVVAPAGSGKGTLSLAAEVIEPIDERLREESEHRLEEWKLLEPKEKKNEPRPPFRRLRLGADSSLRALTDGLLDNDERGLIFETEIKVLAAALKQDWGDFKGLLLKAAEQEPYERERKEDGPAYIRRPEIAAALSGTPRSFTDWLEDAEDGLFSRFLFYSFEAPPVWLNQFEDASDEALERALARIGERLFAIWRALNNRPADDHGRTVPLYLQVDDEGRRIVNESFAELLSHVDENERPELYASVKRGAFQAVRIAGILAAYRLAAAGANLANAKTFGPTADEVRAAVSLVRCLLSHAAHLAQQFAADPAGKLESEERRQFYEALPQVFETSEAQEIGRAMGMKTRKVERALNAMIRADILTRESRGRYRKPASDTLPPPMAGLSEASEASEASERMPAAP